MGVGGLSKAEEPVDIGIRLQRLLVDTCCYFQRPLTLYKAWIDCLFSCLYYFIRLSLSISSNTELAKREQTSFNITFFLTCFSLDLVSDCKDLFDNN